MDQDGRRPWIQAGSGWRMLGAPHSQVDNGAHAETAHRISLFSAKLLLVMSIVICVAIVAIHVTLGLHRQTYAMPGAESARLLASLPVFAIAGAVTAFCVHRLMRQRGDLIIDPHHGYIDIPDVMVTGDAARRAAHPASLPPHRTRVHSADILEVRYGKWRIRVNNEFLRRLTVRDRYGSLRVTLSEVDLRFVLSLLQHRSD